LLAVAVAVAEDLIMMPLVEGEVLVHIELVHLFQFQILLAYTQLQLVLVVKVVLEQLVSEHRWVEIVFLALLLQMVEQAQELMMVIHHT